MLHTGHGGSTQVQSPAIGYALRQALSLDAAGSMGMDAGLTVHPVAIVADIRSALGSNKRSYANIRQVAAGGAGQIAKIALEVQPPPAPGIEYLIPRRFSLLTDTPQPVYWTIGYNTPPAGTTAPVRSLVARTIGAGAGRLVGGTDAVAPNVAFQMGQLQLVGNAQVFWVPPQEIIIEQDPVTPLSIFFQCAATNSTLTIGAEWDEYVP